MLASYILKNLSEDKDEQNKKDRSAKNEQNKKDQSPKNSPSKSNLTPKFAGKRLVSILNPKDVNSKQPTNEQEGKQDAEQERHESDEMSSEKFADHAYDKNKKGSKSITDTQSIETVMESEDNIGNDKSSQVPYNDEDDSPLKTPKKTIDSIFPINQTIELTKCDDAKCGCNAVHCPFCAPNRFKPTMPSRVRDHLENKHFSHAVQYEDLLILKCYKTCFKRSDCHFHCPVCKDVTFLKRIGLIRHLISHARKQGKKSTVVKVPDIKHPSTVTVNGHEVDVCKEDCQGTDSADPHYHCPMCKAVYSDRKSIVCHLWRCEVSKEGKHSEGNKDKGKNIKQITEQLEKAYSITSDLPPVTENKDIVGHISIVRNLKDISTEKCTEDNCCGNKRHCLLCFKEKFKPTYLKKLQMHHYSHWNRRIHYKGYFILTCYKDCQILDGTATKIWHHFHCPICGGTRRRRDCFLHHLTICRGKDKPVSRVPFDKSHIEQIGLEDKMLEEVDQSIEGEINHAIFDQQDDNDFVENSDDSPKIGHTDTTADMEEEQNDFEPKNLKIFSNVTADISDQLLSVLKSRGLDNVLNDVSGQTGAFYLVSPGTVSAVHSLHGELKAITKAKQMIAKILGIEENGKVEKSTNTDGSYESSSSIPPTDDHQADVHEDSDPDETPVKSKRGRKRGSIIRQLGSVPKKKIKKEPVNFTYEQVSSKSSEDTPQRKYSTRGVRVDFAKLLAGINRKDALIEDSEVETVEITRSDGKNKKKTSSNLSKALTKRQKALLAKSVKKTSTKESPEDDQTSDESEKDENLDESQDETYVQDDFLDNDETADDTGGNGDMDDDAHGGGDMDDATLTSSSTAFLVKKYRLSTCAVIPKIVVPVATPSKRTSDKLSKISGRKWFNVVDKYGCMKCDFTCTNFISCSDHMIKEHSTDSIFRCDICERHFDKSYHLKIHLETKHGPQLDVKQLQCQYCKKEYVNAYALELHVDSIHRNPERSKFSCRRCSFVGEDRPDLETHVQENHYHVGVMCTVCGKSFRNKNFLDQHTENIHVKHTEYNCTICDKTFRNKRSFFQHKSVHSDVKKHPCPFCGKSFRKRGNMMAHVETHREKEDRSYRYSCNYCSRKMNSKANFVEHMNKHTGDRPFLCEICGKSFSYRTAVYKHKTFCHNTNAPFKCTVCDKSFKVLRLLNQHMTTHTGQSHYKCDGCEKMFTTSTTLKNHKPKCKGMNVLQPMSGNVVIFSSPNLGTQHVEIAAGESIFQTRHINFKEENIVSTDTVVPESGALVIAETNELPKTNIEAPAMEVGSDVAVYLCSECNAVFNDFSLAEQHVLMGHEPTSSTNQMQPSNNNVVEAVNVVFKEVPDSL